jgi:hypothetical protein
MFHYTDINENLHNTNIESAKCSSMPGGGDISFNNKYMV